MMMVQRWPLHSFSLSWPPDRGYRPPVVAMASHFWCLRSSVSAEHRAERGGNEGGREGREGEECRVGGERGRGRERGGGKGQKTEGKGKTKIHTKLLKALQTWIYTCTCTYHTGQACTLASLIPVTHAIRSCLLGTQRWTIFFSFLARGPVGYKKAGGRRRTSRFDGIAYVHVYVWESQIG